MGLTQISTNGVKDNAVTGGKIPANAVGVSEIANDAVTTGKIADDAVTNAKIAAGAVGGTQLGGAAVTAAKIGSSEVTAAAIAANAVGTAKINDDAVTYAKMQNTANGVRFLGKHDSGGGEIGEITAAQARTMLNVADGATNSPTTTINNNADNRVITGSGTANTLNAESNVTINSDGDLLIGRTSTIDTSEVLGIKGPSGDHCTLGLTTDGTTNLGIIAFNDNDANFRGQIRYSHSGDVMQFHAGGSERINVSADGIKFNGDSAAANALDDYEVGSWTPSIANGTYTLYNQAWYIKIGKLVTCYFYIYNFSDTSSSTQFVIGGLPYAYNNSPKHESFFEIQHGGSGGSFNTDTIGIQGRIGQKSDTEVEVRQQRFNNSSQSLLHSNLGNAHLHTTFSYEAA